MALAKCGKMWSWDSPWWCSGKKIDKDLSEEQNNIAKMCFGCPWWKGNKKED